MNPCHSAFNPDGSRCLYQRASSGSMPMYAFNVLNEMDNSGDETNGNAINMQAHVSYNVIDDLKLEGTLSYVVATQIKNLFYGRYLLRASVACRTDRAE